MIWNSKFKKFTTEYNLSAIDAINEIIRFLQFLEHQDIIGGQKLT